MGERGASQEMMDDYECIKLDGEGRQAGLCPVVVEAPLSIFINGRHFATAMISPNHRAEFLTGHLYSERIISGREEMQSLEIEGDVARAVISHPLRAIVPRRPIVSGCGGIASFLDQAKLPRIDSDLKIDIEQAREAMAAISLSELHMATGGVHCVGLFGDGEPIIIEDIGRHNALDKAIGSSLMRRNGFDFGRSYVACTGRVSSDMALKCSVAGIPLVLSRGATTSLAISIAQRTGLCIIGFLRGKRMTVYCHGHRLEG